MRAQLTSTHIERLIIDKQADQLAVGDVDDRLPGLRQAIGTLGVRQRPHLVNPVEIAPRQAVRLALLQVAPPPHVTVGQREHRLRLGQLGQVQMGLPKHPRLYRECALLRHCYSISSARSATTISAPCSFSASACPTRSTPATNPEPARPARRHAGQRVLEYRRFGRPQPEGPRSGQEGIRGWLSPQVLLFGHGAVDPHLKQVLKARAGQHIVAVGAGGHHGAAQSRVPGRPEVADRAGVRLHPVLADPPREGLVLAVAEAADGQRAGRIVIAALWQLDAAGRQERPGPVGPGLPVHILLIVRGPERDERLTRLLRTLAQVAVEHLFPRGAMDLRRLGQYTVQIKEASTHAIRETKHSLTIRAPIRYR